MVNVWLAARMQRTATIGAPTAPATTGGAVSPFFVMRQVMTAYCQPKLAMVQ